MTTAKPLAESDESTSKEPGTPGGRMVDESRTRGRVRVTLESGFAVFDALLYGPYQAELSQALQGAPYDRERRQRIAPLDRVSRIMRQLSDADLDVIADEELLEAVTRRDRAVWAARRDLEDRIDTVDAEIFARKKNHIYPFQRTGIIWCSEHERGLLADQQGLGKTLQALVALPAGAPLLVIAPAVAKGVWVGEAEKWRPGLRATMLSGRTSFTWPREGELLVTNYDILPSIHDSSKCDGFLPAKPCPGCGEKDLVFRHGRVFRQKVGHKPKCKARGGMLPRVDCPGCHPFLLDARPGTVVVLDEIHRVKNRKAGRTKKTAAICAAVRKVADGRNLGLSGTPLENDPKELWTILTVLGCADEAFGSYDGYAKVFNATLTPHGYKFGKPDPSTIREKLAPVMLRRLRHEVLPELPRKRWQIVEVDVSLEAMQACDAAVERSGHTVVEIADMLEDEEGPTFGRLSALREALANAKIPAMLEQIEDLEEADEPVVVFSAHRAPIDALANRPGWAVITGDTPPAKRKEIEVAYETGKLRGVAATIRAGGEALTLVRGHVVLFCDLDWKSTANEQAEDRVMRLGQTRGVLVIILMSKHEVDKRVVVRLHEKRVMISESVDAARATEDAMLESGEAGAELVRAFEAVRGARLEMGERSTARTVAEVDLIDDLHALSFESQLEAEWALELAERSGKGLLEEEWALVRLMVQRASAQRKSA